QDLASPVGAFVRDCCETGPDRSVQIDDLYTVYRSWADDNGHSKITKQTLGRDLRAALSGRVKVTQPRDTPGRPRVYVGIDLTDEAEAEVALHKAERSKR